MENFQSDNLTWKCIQVDVVLLVYGKILLNVLYID